MNNQRHDRLERIRLIAAIAHDSEHASTRIDTADLCWLYDAYMAAIGDDRTPDAVLAAITYLTGPRAGEIAPRALATYLARHVGLYEEGES